MKHKWTADVTNDPTCDFALCIDISQNDQHRATVLRAPEGKLVLRWYADTEGADIPVDWLISVLQKAETDLK